MNIKRPLGVLVGLLILGQPLHADPAIKGTPGLDLPNKWTQPQTFNGGLTGTAFGTSVGSVLGPLTNYQGSGFPALGVTSRLIFYQSSPAAADFATIQLERTTAFTSAVANVNSNLRATTTVGANDGTHEWALLGNCQTVGTNGGSCVGVTGHGFRNSGGTQATWGGVSEAKDNTGLASGTSGAHGTVGHEVDVEANLLDTGTNALSITGTGNRVGVQIVAGRAVTADVTLTEVATGTLYSVLTTAAYFDRLIGSNNDVMAQYGLDMRGVTAPTGSSNPVTSVVMSAGQAIEFNGATGAGAFAGTPARSLKYITSGTKFQYLNGATEFFSITDLGTTTISGPNGKLFEFIDPAAAIVNSAHLQLSYSNAVNTWTLGMSAGSNLVIQAGGAGKVSLHQTETAANGSVATTMTSLGPTGSHTTIQEWMVVTNSSGVTRWIPAY